MKRTTLICISVLLSGLLAMPALGQFTITELVSPNAEAGGNFGVSVSDAGDVNNDGVPDMIVGAVDETAGAAGAGRAYVFSGVDGSLLLPALVSPNPEVNGRFGQTVSDAGDVNNDGFDDVIVTAIREDGGSADAGRIYVFSGATGGLLFPPLESPLPRSFGDFGISLGAIGDVNADGHSICWSAPALKILAGWLVPEEPIFLAARTAACSARWIPLIPK